ncbi:hypothetical protein P7K49_026123, partial [Saguinus oedipus]
MVFAVRNTDRSLFPLRWREKRQPARRERRAPRPGTRADVRSLDHLTFWELQWGRRDGCPGEVWPLGGGGGDGSRSTWELRKAVSAEA